MNYDDLIKTKNVLIKDKLELESLLKLKDKDIIDIKQKIADKCGELNKHQWIKEREYCYDGNTYVYCSLCGKDKYHNIIYDI